MCLCMSSTKDGRVEMQDLLHNSVLVYVRIYGSM